MKALIVRPNGNGQGNGQGNGGRGREGTGASGCDLACRHRAPRRPHWTGVVPAILLLWAQSHGPLAAEDILNTLPGYDQHSAWGATGPNATDLGSGRPYGDTDVGWRFLNGAKAHFIDAVELPLSEASWLTGRIADVSIWTDVPHPAYQHLPGQVIEEVRISNAAIGSPALSTFIFSGTNRLEANTWYWVVLSVPGNEIMRWWQDEAALPDAWGAWRKDLGEWQAPVAGGNAGAMRVAGTVAPPPGPSAPVITQAFATADGFVIRGTNGTPSTPYHVLHAPDLALPPAQWTPVLTNTIAANGTFDCTNGLPLGVPQGYFRLLCPGGAAGP